MSALAWNIDQETLMAAQSLVRARGTSVVRGFAAGFQNQSRALDQISVVGGLFMNSKGDT